MKVLVGEKDSSLLSHILELIRSWGYRAEGSKTGQETLEKAGEKLFDLILLDLTMPGMNAQDLIVKLKELRPEMGIITMTDTNTNGLENEIRTLGIVYYMLKPISGKVLKEILDHIAEKGRKKPE